MTSDLHEIHNRLRRLESNNRKLAAALTTAVCIVCVSLLCAWTQARPPVASPEIRTRSLIIEDASGTPRVLLGSPIPDRSAQGNPRTGIVINDARGVERFAVGLFKDERIVMGFDAPVGKGDDRNRERITIVADENGGGYIRFLDRRTRVPARMYLADDDRVWLEFIGSDAKEIVRRRIGLSGDEELKGTQ